MRLDAVEEEAEEEVLPTVFAARLQPFRAAGRGEPGAVGFQHIEAEAVPEGRRDRQPLEGRGRRHAPAVPEKLRPPPAPSSASQSGMRSRQPAPARYHSSRVNSGWCVAERSPLRKTRANWKQAAGLAGGPAASSSRSRARCAGGARGTALPAPAAGRRRSRHAPPCRRRPAAPGSRPRRSPRGGNQSRIRLSSAARWSSAARRTA